MNRNQSLFFYGFKAWLTQSFGVFLIIVGVVSLSLVILFGFPMIIVSTIIVIIGFVQMFKGASKRFDFERRSGYIMYDGNHWR